MTNKNIFEQIGNIDDDLIEDANKSSAKKKQPLKFYIPIAACLALVFAIGIPTIALNAKNQIKLENSQNAKAKYINKAPFVVSADCLIPLSEDEIFSKFDLAIFKGTIKEIKNIEVSYNGSLDYRAIAKIEIEKVYKGSSKIGDIVSVLLTCPIDTEFKMTETATVSAMREGMSGIFMPMKYDESSVRIENDATVGLRDLAEYGFADGERYAFLETENGLLFSSSAYKSVSSATSLDEIEKYVVEKVKVNN
ncbi:MAG: hypothetical protein RR239_05105 [Oscillospiraceae bacterium]